MRETDILIIGAGVVGLAIADTLSAISDSVVIVERHESFGRETSSRNSEVIHGGIYYPPDSLKARLCTRGRELLYNFCAANNVPYKKTGKLIIATEKEEISSVESLFDNACKNHVPSLRIMGKDEIRRIEPDIVGFKALHSPETGIIDSHSLMRRLAERAKANGAVIAFNSEVTAIEKSKVTDNYDITVRATDGLMVLSARVVINCGGLNADTIAGMVGIDVKENGYGLKFCKGQYFRVSAKKASRVRRLVYPVPRHKSGGLGIHVTPDLGGGLRLGPDHEYLNDRVLDYSVDESKKRYFYESVKKFMPFIEEGDMSTDTAGIRPQLLCQHGNFADFIIKDELGSGFPGFVNLIGIESPGLTASLAIAEHVRQVVAFHLNSN